MNKNNQAVQLDLFESAAEAQKKREASRVNLLDVAATEAVESPLELVRLGNDQTALIPFTPDSQAVELHFCRESEINSYIICNGPDCVLCRIGRKQEQRLLLPVYLPAAGCIGILPVSRSLRPFALLPQLTSALKVEKPMVAFVTRDGSKYNVSTMELQDDVDGGEEVIKAFLEDFRSGVHDLAGVYPKIENEQLAEVQEIGRMMQLKGIKKDAFDKRA